MTPEPIGVRGHRPGRYPLYEDCRQKREGVSSWKTMSAENRALHEARVQAEIARVEREMESRER